MGLYRMEWVVMEYYGLGYDGMEQSGIRLDQMDRIGYLSYGWGSDGIGKNDKRNIEENMMK